MRRKFFSWRGSTGRRTKTKRTAVNAVLFTFVMSRQSGADRLGLSVQTQGVVPHLAPPSGLFVSAEGQRRVENVVAVDPHGARAQMFRGAVGFADVARPDGGSQAVFAVVGARQNFLGVVERHRRYHGHEDFFPHDFHVFARVHENSGLHEVSFVAFSVTPRKSSGAFREARLKVAADAV